MIEGIIWGRVADRKCGAWRIPTSSPRTVNQILSKVSGTVPLRAPQRSVKKSPQRSHNRAEISMKICLNDWSFHLLALELRKETHKTNNKCKFMCDISENCPLCRLNEQSLRKNLPMLSMTQVMYSWTRRRSFHGNTFAMKSCRLNSDYLNDSSMNCFLNLMTQRNEPFLLCCRVATYKQAAADWKPARFSLALYPLQWPNQPTRLDISVFFTALWMFFLPVEGVIHWYDTGNDASRETDWLQLQSNLQRWLKSSSEVLVL